MMSILKDAGLKGRAFDDAGPGRNPTAAREYPVAARTAGAPLVPWA